MNKRIAVGHATQYAARDMVGYAVTSRIQAAAPRARWGRAPGTAADRTDVTSELTPTELIGRPLEQVLAERMAALRTTFAQTTFFLFDPNSWR